MSGGEKEEAERAPRRGPAHRASSSALPLQPPLAGVSQLVFFVGVLLFLVQFRELVIWTEARCSEAQPTVGDGAANVAFLMPLCAVEDLVVQCVNDPTTEVHQLIDRNVHGLNASVAHTILGRVFADVLHEDCLIVGCVWRILNFSGKRRLAQTWSSSSSSSSASATKPFLRAAFFTRFGILSLRAARKARAVQMQRLQVSSSSLRPRTFLKGFATTGPAPAASWSEPSTAATSGTTSGRGGAIASPQTQVPGPPLTLP
eukprot:CAMPEP_0117527030 /NCGR_PEP_ID=MMETSP0784-20121206/36589_1 /TAXON_ID=39447 /ORGANISM="" /LENGTH=258 /DNA_ID=CAMNT_0005323273 /DNA_START=23 /DNA_END=797 /DNA_ORIENTATION=-